MVDINIPKIVKSYVPLHRSTPLNVETTILSPGLIYPFHRRREFPEKKIQAIRFPRLEVVSICPVSSCSCSGECRVCRLSPIVLSFGFLSLLSFS